MKSLFDLAGRVAIVTGGNGGIGLGMAKGLAQAGASVVVAGRDKARNEQAVAQLDKGVSRASAMAHAVDVTQEAACAQLIEATIARFGRLDILVNNAGTNLRKPPQDYTLDEWNTLIDTNLTSAFLCARAAYEPMVAQGGGKIINIGSMTSIFGASFAAPYSATKGGIVQFTKAIAVAWAKDNIQANAILPGWIDTALTVQARKDVEGLHERVVSRTPAGRWGVPDDFAGVAVFLASAASDFVTGAAIPVDGGYSSQG